MIAELILDALRLSSGTSLRQRVAWAAHAIRKHEVLAEALRLTETAIDPGARWLFATLNPSEETWARVVDSESRDIPDALVQRARIALDSGDKASAIQLLRQAYYCDCDLSTLVRTETLAKKVFDGSAYRRTARIALLSSSNTMMLRTALQLFCRRDGIEAQMYEPDYGTWMQEILTPGSGLYDFKPDFVVMLQNWRDLSATASLPELWDRLLSETDCSIIQVTPNTPSYDANLEMSHRAPDGQGRRVSELNLRMVEGAPDRVLFVHSDSFASRVSGPWEDPVPWSASRLYPSAQALPILAEAILSNIRLACGLNSKLVAVDLDNTLWGGVIGEDGLGGIKLGPPSPEGERFRLLQEYLKALSARGILLAAVSKNNPQDVLRVFAEHDACALKREDFAAFEVNWESKVDSLRRIASTLRLGLDSFLFLDDNAVERAAVRAALPEVVVPNISGEPSETIAALERFGFFQASKLTDEDRSRMQSYRALASAAGEMSAANPDELLASLQIVFETGPVDEATSNRVAQLINKTNQFNLTTRRYTAAQVSELMKSPEHWFMWFKVKDRFADHGLVGLMLAEGLGSMEWRVDLWLMSCRVIGRKLEEFMFDSLVSSARQNGAQAIRAEYLPTEKNQLASSVLPRFGFSKSGGEGQYRLDLS